MMSNVVFQGVFKRANTWLPVPRSSTCRRWSRSGRTARAFDWP